MFQLRKFQLQRLNCGMFELRDVWTAGCLTCRMFPLRRLALRMFELRKFHLRRIHLRRFDLQDVWTAGCLICRGLICRIFDLQDGWPFCILDATLHYIRIRSSWETQNPKMTQKNEGLSFNVVCIVFENYQKSLIRQNRVHDVDFRCQNSNTYFNWKYSSLLSQFL